MSGLRLVPARLRLVAEQPSLRERREHARPNRDPVHPPVTRLRTVNGTPPAMAGCHTNCRCGGHEPDAA